MINVLYGNYNVNLTPQDFEKYPKSYGEATEMNPELGIIEDKYENERGGVFNYFLMSWNFAEQDEVDGLKKILVATPCVETPAKLTWHDGSKHYVVFAQIGEDKCRFDKSIEDIATGTKLYEGSCAFIEITKEEN